MLPLINLGDITIYTYPLMLGIVWGISFHFSQYLIRLKKVEIKNFNLFFIIVFICGWLGAKALFLLTLDEHTLAKAGLSSSFWFGGGFVFYGGAIGGFLAILAYAQLRKIKLSHFEFVIPVLVLCHSLGRIGCFLAGCCFGKESDLPWSIQMHGAHRHPVQIYESFILFVLCIVFLRRFKAGKSNIFPYFFSYAIARFILEAYRGDKIRGESVIFSLSTSQTVSLAVAFISLFFLIRRRANS